METAYLSLDFSSGPKYVPLVMSGNVASFRCTEDIKYARVLIESWLNLNSNISHVSYLDQMKHVFKQNKKTILKSIESSYDQVNCQHCNCTNNSASIQQSSLKTTKSPIKSSLDYDISPRKTVEFEGCSLGHTRIGIF